MRKQQNMLKISLRKTQTLRVNNSRFIRIKNAKFSRYEFKWFRTYKKIFESAFVHLENIYIK